MKNLEMKELEIVTGGGLRKAFKRNNKLDAEKEEKRYALLNKPTATFVCDYDREDMEYLEDILDPEDLYEYFAV